MFRIGVVDYSGDLLRAASYLTGSFLQAFFSTLFRVFPGLIFIHVCSPAQPVNAGELGCLALGDSVQLRRVFWPYPGSREDAS